MKEHSSELNRCEQSIKLTYAAIAIPQTTQINKPEHKLTELATSRTGDLKNRLRRFNCFDLENLTLDTSESESESESAAFDITRYKVSQGSYLGNGCFNEAFRLEHKKRKGKFIAIKVPLKRMYKSNLIESDIKRINREYKDEYELQKEWEHPNVIKVLGHGYLKIDTLGGLEKSYKEKTTFSREGPRNDLEVPFIAMEIADGGTLKDVIDQEKRNGTYSSGITSTSRSSALKKHNEMMTRRMRQILEGLKYIHGKGIGHGDMHLGNVLVFNTPHGEILKLIDIRRIGQSTYGVDDEIKIYLDMLRNSNTIDKLLDLNDSTRLLEFKAPSQWPSWYKLAMDFRQFVRDTWRDNKTNKNWAALALEHNFLKDATYY